MGENLDMRMLADRDLGSGVFMRVCILLGILFVLVWVWMSVCVVFLCVCVLVSVCAFGPLHVPNVCL